MKKLILILGLTGMNYLVRAQEVNFRTLDDTKHLITAIGGADYNTYYGISYGYVLNTRVMPLVVGGEFTLPFGNDVADDWRWKGGIQGEVLKLGNFSLVWKISGVVRRYESELSRIYSFGSDLVVNAGYFGPRWSLVGIAGMDKAIATHIRHDLLKEYYPNIRDGWYVPTGGNFRFGARVQYSVKTWNAFLSAGKIYGQNFKDNPTLPFFLEVSLQKRIGRAMD
jgi:hypothetical protein